MKKYYHVSFVASTYSHVMVEADNAEKAIEIAKQVDLNETFEETEAYEFFACDQINREEYFYPTIRESKEGYEIIAHRNV